jgi:hypothetical protein
VRRSLAVKLTLLPMLASAAVAAQPALPGPDDPDDPADPAEQPPGEIEPMLSPPGLTPATPALDECQDDPTDPPCPPEEEQPESEDGGYARGIFGGPIRIRRHHHHHHGVFRGGFGHYSWASGG